MHASSRGMSDVAGPFGFTSVPVWLLALAAAGAAPVCVRLYADALEKRVRAHTERMLAAAFLSDKPGPGQAVEGTEQRS